MIAPGRLLVTAAPKERKDADPVMESFLAFLARDIANAPHAVRPLDTTLAERIDRLVDGIDVSPDEELEDEVILDEVIL